jgi:hypothetical protein
MINMHKSQSGALLAAPHRLSHRDHVATGSRDGRSVWEGWVSDLDLVREHSLTGSLILVWWRSRDGGPRRCEYKVHEQFCRNALVNFLAT